MPGSISLQIDNPPIDDQSCTAGRLLAIFDQEGEAAMLNALHARNPEYRDDSSMVFEDGSVVTYITRMQCYSFGSEQRNPIHDCNPLRFSQLGIPPAEANEETIPEARVADVTNHTVLTEAMHVIAGQQKILLPEGLNVHHGLIIHMAPSAPDALEKALEDHDENDEMAEHVLAIRRILSSRMLLNLPAYQQQQLIRTAHALAATRITVESENL